MKVCFFDDDCPLCCGTVHWIHRRDRLGEIWFAALGGDFAAQHREALNLPEAGVNAESFAFWVQEREGEQEGGLIVFKSEAVMALLRELGGGWAGLAVLLAIIPLVVRDAGYDLVARNRRKCFGTREGCVLSPPSLREKFLR